jgi:hypothetical protein
VVVHALVDQDATGGVEMEGVAEDTALEVAGAEGALLQECGGEAAFSEGGKGPGRVVAQDDDSVGEIDFERSGFKGEDATEGLPADLVGHVVRVGEGTDDDLAVPVSPPPDDGAPAVQGGVPGDDYDVGGAGFSSEKGCVEGTGDEGPQGATGGGEVLEDTTDEDSGLGYDGWEGDDLVEIWVGLGADDGGEEGGEREDVG